MRLLEDWPNALARQRRREIGALFGGVPAGALGCALDLGGGDGFVASLLAPLCTRLVVTDRDGDRLASGAPGPPRTCCDSRRLPFADRSFDFIFSSSSLPYVRPLEEALAELRRCLRPGGVMVHVFPSQTWKALQLVLYYPRLLIVALDFVLRLVTGEIGGRRPARAGRARRRSVAWRDVLRVLLPPREGDWGGYRAEYRAFAVDAWRARFGESGFAVHGVVRLPLYSGYGLGLERLRRLGERRGLSAHNALIVTHAGERPPAVDLFLGG